MMRAAALLLAAVVTVPATASELSLGQRYLRMRAADAAGDAGVAATETATLLQAEPRNRTIALQAYRQAVIAGDKPLALRAAHVLQGQDGLPPDAPILFAIDAVQRRDWAEARTQVDALDAGKLFGFLVPSLRAWIALGAGDRDPQALLGTDADMSQLVTQRALMMLALGRPGEAAALVPKETAGSRLRLLIAAALLRDHKDTEANALLVGDDDVLVLARARLAAGHRLDIGIDGPAAGIGELLIQTALDLNRQQLAPVALVVARMATFAAPANTSGWIATANLLGKAGKPEAALAALDHVPPRDLFADTAQTLRVALLLDKGDKPGALAAVVADVKDGDAGPTQWGRLGDVYLAVDRPADAAGAYAKAISLGPPESDLWTLWLQRGAALELAGDWAAAKPALEKAHALAPNEPVVLNHLGYSELSRRENVGAASRMIALASKLRPDDAAITDSLGWAHYLQGDVAGALPLLERASGSEQGEPTINEHLGDAYWTAGRRIEARYAWRAALVTAEDKDSARIRAKLDQGLTPATVSP